MCSRKLVLFLCLSLASAAGAETIYKYRRADGRVMYSNRPAAGLELIETFDYRFPAPAPSSTDAARREAAKSEAAKSDAEGEARIRKYLDALQAAWNEVQDAGRALAAAEERLRAGDAPLLEEGRSLGGPEKPAVPGVGGPQAPAPPAVGGAGPAAPASVGGPMGTRRGGGRSPEYVERMQGLETEVQKARARFDAALRRYNELR
jgi:hypothetical protein